MKNRYFAAIVVLFVLLVPAIAFSAMQLAIEVNPAPVRPDELMSVSATISNSGSTDLTNVELRLRYPEYLNSLSTSYISTGGTSNTVSCVGNSSTTYCEPGETVVWRLGTIPAGGGVSVNMLPRVYYNVPDKTLIQIDAEIWIDGLQNVQESRTITVESDPLFELSIAGITEPDRVDDQIVYSLIYSNVGTSSSETLLTFPVPSNTNFISATNGGTYADGVVTWDLDSLTNGSSSEQRVRLAVSGSEGDLVMVDSVELSGTDSSYLDHTTQANSVVRLSNENLPGLVLTLNPAPVRPNESLDVAATVSNPGSEALANVELRLRYPEHLSSLSTSYISTGGASNTVSCVGDTSSAYCQPGEVVVWKLGTIPAGGGVSVNMLPKVYYNVEDGTLIQFEAEIWVDGKQKAQQCRTVVVQSNPLFELSIAGITEPVHADEEMIYSLAYSNVGTSSSETLLTFPVPSNTNFISATNGGTYANGVVTWDLDSLTSGSSGEQRVKLAADGSEGDLLEVYSVELSGTDSSYLDHTTQANSVVRVSNENLPGLVLTLNPAPVRPNESLDVAATVSNPGSEALTNVELRLRYPEHLSSLSTSYISTGGASNTVSCVGDTSTTSCQPGDVVVWKLGTIPSGGGVSVNMLPEVYYNAEDGTLIQFEAEIWVDGKQKVQQSRTVVVQSNPLFELSIAGITEPVSIDGEMIYSLTYSNVGTSSSSTQLVFPLPSNTNFISATNGGIYADGVVTWDLDSLTSGSSGEQRVKLAADGSEGDLLEVYSVELSGTDSSYLDYTVQANSVVRLGNEDLPGLVLTLNPAPVRPNESLEVAATVSNPGSEALTNVELRLRYPEHLNSLSTSYISTGGASNTVSCVGDTSTTSCQPGEVVVWKLGTIPAGGGVSVNMFPKVYYNVEDGTLIQFEAEIWVDGKQKVQQSRAVVVQSNPLFELSIDESFDPMNSGSVRAYSLIYSNVGISSSLTKLSFPLPGNTSFVSATDNGIYADGVVTWNLSSLEGGRGGERKVWVVVNGSEGQLFTVDSLRISGIDSGYINNSTQANSFFRIKNENKPNLVLNLNPNPVLPDQALNFSATLSNPGSTPLTNVELRLRYPDHLSSLYTSYISTGGLANTVSCVGDTSTTSCQPGEFVVWRLGTMPAGGSVSVSMSPEVYYNVPYGTLIQFDAEVRIDGRQTLSIGKTSFVGSSFSWSGPPLECGDMNNDNAVSLTDLVLVLQNISGILISPNGYGDCNGDGKIGMPEALAIMQKLQ